MGPSSVTVTDLVRAIEARHESALDRLGEAVVLAAHLQATADELLDHFVRQARATGASWSAVGAALGVTKQAAQQRFVRRPNPTVADLGTFARYDDGARAAVLAAHQRAAKAGQAELGLVHLALGILETADSDLVGALRAATIDPVALRAAIAVHLPATAAPATQSPAFNDDCKAAMAFAHQLAGTSAAITPGHLLAGVAAIATDPLRATIAPHGLHLWHPQSPGL